MKKGFTLIELLVTIFLLAIVATITTPIIFNIMEKSRKSALISSAESIIRAGEDYKAEQNLDPTNVVNTLLISDLKSDEKLDYNGKKLDGKLLINQKGESSIALWDGNYCAVKTTTDSEVSVHDSVTSKEECLEQELRPMNVLQTGLYLGAYNTVSFVGYLPEDTTSTTDVSEAQDGSILLWTDANNNAFIGSEKVVAANPDSKRLFAYASIATDSLLTSIEFNDWFDTSKVTNMQYMFNRCKKITSLDLSSFDTSKVTTMYGMFAACVNLSTLDLSGFNTSKVKSMTIMFGHTGYNAESFYLDVSGWDTSSVTNTQQMFDGAGYEAKTWNIVGISDWDTSNVKSLKAMFRSAGYHSKSFNLDLSGWNTSSVRYMEGMFADCLNLTSLDLSSFDTSNVIAMSSMFSNCSNLEVIYVSSSFDTSAVTNSTNMFSECTSLVGGSGTTYDASNIDVTYAHIDGGTSNPGYFTKKA